MKKIIKKILPPDSGLFRFLSKQYRSLFKIWLPERRSVESVLQEYAENNQDVFFIQIGSNDGVSNDPINNYIVNHKWKGILVEPVKFLFDKLKLNHRNSTSHLIFENAAIAKNDGTAIFYRIKETDDPNTPFWYSQIGSFDKQVLLSHKDNDNFEKLIVEEEINTISFSSLVKKYSISKVNVIHIDTEGYDYEILKLIDFKKLHTSIVIYEYVHLSLTDFIKSLRLLKSNGFRVFVSNLDIVCVKTL